MRGALLKAVPLWLWGVGASFLIMFALAATQLPATWAVREGNGTYGTWVATRSICEYRTCRTVGDFHPDRGGTIRTDIGLTGAREAPIGSRYRAIDTDGWENSVYIPGYKDAFSGRLWTSALFLVLLGAWFAGVVHIARKRSNRIAQDAMDNGTDDEDTILDREIKRFGAGARRGARLLSKNVHELDVPLPMPHDAAVRHVQTRLENEGGPLHELRGWRTESRRVFRFVFRSGRRYSNPAVITVAVLSVDSTNSTARVRGVAKAPLAQRDSGKKAALQVARRLSA
ncbi:hypothetical protein JK358_00895 [Nocardia sp. 2]|uniref:DUF3592 domain-containing protein n=1 Tax=Nocardia acididurans TaxID=2802282 RepID=A0ABS1LXR2_9NOCA|nr:hypothetical protein [Nocardia acididurans]MBL1072946.1 hypothetical protein [Nocardia acididurans]